MKKPIDYIGTNIEHAALGLLLRNNAAVVEFREDDFAHDAHKRFLSKMKALFAENQTFKVMDFANYEDESLPEDMSAMNYLQDCGDIAFDTSHAQAITYRDYLRNFAQKRHIIELTEAIHWKLEENSASDILQWLHQQTLDGWDSKRIKTAAEVQDNVLKSLDLPKERWSTGLAPLDKGMAGGLYRGFTYGFAGQEKAGKTTLGHTISQNLGCKHLYVALEMGSEMIESRNMARKLEVNSMSFLNPNDNLRKKAATLLPNEHIFYLDAPGATFDEITHELAYAAVRHKIEGFIIDYWQFVEGKERGSTEEAHLRSVAQGFANFARKNGLWCILLAQLNKTGELFGSNGLRKACDQLYFIQQPKNFPSHRWLEMDASRYTPKADIGDEQSPCFQLDKINGPHFRAA